jgi:NADH-quinone oxidoreductase subunit H
VIITAVVPWGPSLDIFGYHLNLYIADINVGVLYIMSIASIAVYGIVLAGWSSNNKYAMMGGLRSTAQMISYELALGLSFVSAILLAGSMRMIDIVYMQKPIWFVLLQPVGTGIFLIATLAEVNRAPFDMPEAEQELTAGYHTEYSSMKFALFFMAEYIKMIGIAMIGSTLFLGGFRGPWVDIYPALGPAYLFMKVVIWLFILIWARATLPRFRYDKLMAFGWKILFPLSLLYIVLTAVLVLVVGG